MSRSSLAALAFALIAIGGNSLAQDLVSPASEPIEEQLDQQTQLKFLKGTTLEDALEFISQQFGFETAIDRAALADKGLNPDVGVQLSIDDVSLRGALVALLEPLDLVWYIEDDVMTITTAKGLAWVQRIPPEERFEAVLREETDLNIIEGTTLFDAIEFISRRHDIPILTDWNGALADDQIDRDVPVELQVSGVTLHSALKLLLEPLDLTWLIEDEVVKITTQRAADRILEIRVYDVRHLADGDAALLADAIRQTIRPHTWKPDRAVLPDSTPEKARRFVRGQVDAPNGVATIVPLPGLLVVSQSQGAHAEIMELLERIRDVSGAHDVDTSVRAAVDGQTP